MIEFRNLSVSFDDLTVLESISLQLEDGDFVVIAGANGSGKTTLIRTCNGLVAPDSGQVLVDGVSVADNPVHARTSVGMVFQHPQDQFVAATVGADIAFGPENLGLTHEEIDRRVDDALAAVNMAGRHEDRIDRLSGGEQSRVAIAGALAMEPTHLVLDEPFSGLDEPARQSVLDRIDRLSAAGTGIIVVTHDLRDVLGLADRVIALQDGHIVVNDAPAAARTRLEPLGVRVPPVDRSLERDSKC